MTWSAEAPNDADTTQDRLQQLIDRGFRFIHPRDSHGEMLAVLGVRAHDNVIDVVRLHAEDEAVAARLPGDERDVLDPSAVLWRTDGEADDVLGDLLCLPDRRTPGAPAGRQQPAAPVEGCWIPGHAGRKTWLSATA
jgi:hypothetical protein